MHIKVVFYVAFGTETGVSHYECGIVLVSKTAACHFFTSMVIVIVNALH